MLLKSLLGASTSYTRAKRAERPPKKKAATCGVRTRDPLLSPRDGKQIPYHWANDAFCLLMEGGGIKACLLAD